MPKLARLTFLNALFATVCMASAAAGDVGGACCADLEERVAELESQTANKGNRKASLTVSGLITWPIMVWDDGKDRDAYIVSNEVKRPRVRFAGQGRIDPDLSSGFVLEIGPNPSPFAPMDQTGYDPSAGPLEVRYSYVYAKSEKLGQLALGQQSMATDLATEVSVANTNPIVSPGLPLLLGYVKRGWFMRRADGTLTDLRFGDILLKGRSEVFGDGHRWPLVRYDSPALNGFTLSASWGMDDAKDVALRYSGELGRFKLAGAIGITEWSEGDTPNPRGCALLDRKPDVSCWEVGGSLSVMDTETGLFFNMAIGYGMDRNVRALYGGFPGVDDDETFYYFVAGIERQWFDIGKTTIFGQYWHRNVGAGVLYTGERIDALPLGAGAFVSGADVTVWGASLVQSLGESTEIYLSLNRTETSLRTSASGALTGSTTTRISPFDFLLAGMSVKF